MATLKFSAQSAVSSQLLLKGTSKLLLAQPHGRVKPNRVSRLQGKWMRGQSASDNRASHATWL